jgi:CHAT domain-containing protein/Tfp pilus assembly protein PilF
MAAMSAATVRPTRKRIAATILACALAWACRSGVSSEPSLDALAASATTALREGQFAQAIAFADRGVARTREQPESAAVATFRLLQAEIALFRRDSSTATALLAPPLPSASSFDVLRARQLYLRGLLQLIQDRLPDAENTLGDAARAAASAGATDVEVDARALQGQVFSRLQRWDDARRQLESALAGAKAARDSYRQAVALHNIGFAEMSRARYDAALPYFEEVLAFKELDSYTIHATALTNAALCEARLGDFDRALATLEQAVRMHEARKSPEYLQQALGEMGNAYVLSGRYKDAIPLLRRAMSVAQDAKRDSYAGLWASSLAYAHIELGEWDLAERYNSEAGRLRSDARNRPYQVLNDAQIAEGRGDAAAAHARYDDALTAGRDDPMVVRVVHAGLGRLDIAAGKWQDGLRHYEAAVNTVERTRLDLSSTDYRLSIQSRLLQSYEEYVDALVARSQTDLALAVADSSRGRVLAERQGANAPARLSPSVFRSAAADLRGVLVFYWIGTTRSYAWAVTQDRIRFTALGVTKGEVESLVRRYQEFLVSSIGDPLAASHSPGDDLYQKLIAPLASWIPHGSDVIVVPDGALTRLNFETLPVPGERRHYWIDDVRVAVAPALGVLGKAERSRAAERSVLLIGDAVPADSKYPALRYASAEMAAISGAFSKQTAMYRADQATPARYLESEPARYEIVHFTAHADANTESPLDSAVILSRGQTGYKLYARDVATHPLTAGLVTISACRSAGERTYAGEGLVGFAWAFLRAGAKRVIAGLWDVDDRSTAELMGRIYGQVAAGSSPGAALRAAKLEMIKAGGAASKPYYWGPFQLFIGSRVIP